MRRSRPRRQIPRADVWWGGPAEPHLQAAEEGLLDGLQVAEARRAASLGPRRRRAIQERTVGIYLGALGFGYNAEARRRRSSPSPSAGPICSIPKYKDEVQVADPNSSGTAYVMLATIVQIMGEEKGFDYLKALHKNINQYTKSGMRR